MLGNLSVKQIEERTGVDFPDEIREFMKKNHQPKAGRVAKGKWHCFDIPFAIVCGDLETATKIFKSVEHKADKVKEPLKFQV